MPNKPTPTPKKPTTLPRESFRQNMTPMDEVRRNTSMPPPNSRSVHPTTPHGGTSPPSYQASLPNSRPRTTSRPSTASLGFIFGGVPAVFDNHDEEDLNGRVINVFNSRQCLFFMKLDVVKMLFTMFEMAQLLIH